MSFSSAYNAVSNADTARLNANTNIRQENRAEKQQRLTALQNGYTQDQNGNWVPTDLQKSKTNVEQSKLDLVQQQLANTQQALKAQQSKTYADTIANINESWMSGNQADAINALHNTPGLKEALQNAKSLDFNDIDMVNFNNPEDVNQLVAMGLDKDKLADPEVQKALSNSFMKIRGKDGKTRIVPVDSVTKQTNSHQFFTTKQRDLYANSQAKWNKIIQGALPQEVDVEKSKLDAQQSKLDTSNTMDTMWNTFLGQYNPNSSDEEKQKFAKSASLLYLTMHPEATNKLTSGSSHKRDSLEQYMTAFALANPNATPAQWQNAMSDYAKKSVEGVSSVKETKDINQLSNMQTSKKERTPEQKVTVENTFLKQANNTQKSSVMKTVDLMQNNFNTATNLDRILSTGGEEVTKGVYDNSLTWANKVLGADSEQALKNVDFNTRSGMMLVNFIKSISGTAVSDAERAMLTNIMLGGDLSDETYVRQALKSFSDELKQQNGQLKTNVEEYMPHSADKYTTFKTFKKPLNLDDYRN